MREKQESLGKEKHRLGAGLSEMHWTASFLRGGLGRESWKHSSWEYMKLMFCCISVSLVAGKCASFQYKAQ